MPLDLLAEINKDVQLITQCEFGVDLIFTPKTGSAVNVRGLASKHHYTVDPETGIEMSSKNTHCSVSEEVLVALGYPVRNANGEVQIVGDKVTYTDSSATVRTYTINVVMPDETIGLIVCTLGDYE